MAPVINILCDQTVSTFVFLLQTMEPATHFVGDVCGVLFYYASNLKRHRVIHDKDRNFNCDECDKSFKRSDHLSRHKSTAHRARLVFPRLTVIASSG